MIIAIYDDEPYAHMLPISKIRSDIQTFLSTTDHVVKLDLSCSESVRNTEAIMNPNPLSRRKITDHNNFTSSSQREISVELERYRRNSWEHTKQDELAASSENDKLLDSERQPNTSISLAYYEYPNGAKFVRRVIVILVSVFSLGFVSVPSNDRQA